jgi:hypothetical protein
MGGLNLESNATRILVILVVLTANSLTTPAIILIFALPTASVMEVELAQAITNALQILTALLPSATLKLGIV